MRKLKPAKENKKSRMMDRLYGTGYSEEVFQQLEKLDPAFNDIVQQFAYGEIWARSGLSIRDKSLVTIAALIALGKEEQTKIHIRGFLRSGGTVAELKSVLIHLVVYCGFPAAMNGFSALQIVLERMRNEHYERQ
ncbi:MAG: carboxymuconolactone decarboxylase family protein [Elusimicrobia bacterium]|nr:carboxymuconolactone decarboxylase family protein [Elusimicrobiota bacterium]